jgi:hypothetical protein
MTTEKAIIKSFSFQSIGEEDKVKAFVGIEKPGGQRVSALVNFKFNKREWRLESANRECLDNRENHGMSLLQVLDAHKYARELGINYVHEITPNQLYCITLSELDQN